MPRGCASSSSKPSHRAEVAAATRQACPPADLGLDLGFERAGFRHVASYDTLEAAGETLRANRPKWLVNSGEAGDVRRVDWRPYRGEIAVLHGGPPCQPFSVAGRQRGHEDARNMLPEFARAVDQAEPLSFVCENVPALAGPRFAPYLREAFLEPLSRGYRVTMFKLSAHDHGVPQLRHRIFFVGFRRPEDARRFAPPDPTHRADHLARGPQAPLGRWRRPWALARPSGCRRRASMPSRRRSGARSQVHGTPRRS